MGDFRFVYKSPTHSVEVQIPLAIGCGSLDLSSILPNKNVEKVDVEEETGKKKRKKTVSETDPDGAITAANIGLFMVNMILNSLRDS